MSTPAYTKQRYLLLSDWDAFLLSEKVNDLIEQGWEPLGGISTAQILLNNEDRTTYPTYVPRYMQAMVVKPEMSSLRQNLRGRSVTAILEAILGDGAQDLNSLAAKVSEIRGIQTHKTSLSPVLSRNKDRFERTPDRKWKLKTQP
jgi:hypothetical protein